MQQSIDQLGAARRARFPRRLGSCCLAALLLGALAAPACVDAADPISADQVRESIQKGVDYLKQTQKPDGGWNEWMGQPGGLPALCTLALLNAGVPTNDPVIQKSLARLRRLRLETTYAVALQTMVLCRAEPDQDRLQIARNVKWLESKQTVEGPRRGSWSYPGAAGDNSNAQFALLALFEAEQIGIEVRAQSWRFAKGYWEECQNPDGSFGYYRGVPGSGSMTAAGIASLVITDDRVSQLDAAVEGDKIRCCGRADSNSDRIARALNWLGRNFSITSNPGSSNQVWLLYYLYGLERVGRMTAQRFIGGHDWYREGADMLVRNQDRLSGFWKGVGPTEDNTEIATSLALLFLSKGRRPVLLAKLKHTSRDDWNQHRSDCANLTHYIEQRWKRELTWQVIDLKAAAVDDLVQTPVLYLCGSLSPLSADAREQRELADKIRGYLDRGGFLLAEGYCGQSGFDQGFRRLMQLVFPEPEYRLNLLPPEHPVWFAEEPVDPGQLRPLYGIDYGCRTSVVYAPLDPAGSPRPSLSCLWELNRAGREQKYPAAVQTQVKAALSLGVNIMAYATNREVRFKEDLFRTAAESPRNDPVDRGRLYIAKLRHPGGCNAAPRALANLLESAGRELKIRVSAEQNLVGLTDDTLFNFHMVFMHGRNAFRLTDLERQALKMYLDRGGMLFADSICANRAFTESFRRELAAIYPDKPLAPVPADDPMWTKKFGGFDLATVTRRDPQSHQVNEPLKAALRRVPPALEGLKLDGRYAVVFSPYDLSCALEKQDSLDCQGYVRDDAARIGLNVVLYSLHQ